MRDRILQMFRDKPFGTISNDEIMAEVGVGIQDLDVEVFVELIALEGEDILQSEDGGVTFCSGPNFPVGA
jgi:hypothetical protein